MEFENLYKHFIRQSYNFFMPSKSVELISVILSKTPDSKKNRFLEKIQPVFF